MEKDKAANAESIGQVLPPDTFRSVAAGHQADVRRIRETNRQRRLRYLLYLNLITFAYLLRRLIEDRPLAFGLPQFGADDWYWLFPLMMLVIVSVAVLLPLLNGRSPHVRFSAEEIGVGFLDVRGIDIVLEEVMRTLQIFLTYKSFKEELGGNPRRGILFEGKPGTGKTHMAKAMASEAGVPFLFVSAPAFQSMFYGMTQWKIRSFFKALKKAARKEGGAIGFIEEIDAIGTARGGLDGAAPYRPGVQQERMITSGTGAMVNELLIQLQSFETPTFWRARGSTPASISSTCSFLQSTRCASASPRTTTC